MAGPWWIPVMEAIQVKTNSYYPRGYFYFLWFMCLVLGNFTFSFILDSFSVQRRLHAAKRAMMADSEHGHGHGHGHGHDGHGEGQHGEKGAGSMWWKATLDEHLAGKLDKKTSMGFFDWRAAFLESGVSFKGWRVIRKPHHADAEEELHAPLLKQVFSKLLGRTGGEPEGKAAAAHDHDD